MNRIIPLVLLCILTGCKKETNISYELETETKQIVLNLEVNNNTSLLTWNKYEGSGFISYKIVRYEGNIENGFMRYTQSVVATINDVNTTSLIDTLPEECADIAYNIDIELADSSRRVFSDKATIGSRGPYKQGNYDDVLINEKHQLLYFLNRNDGIISTYSYVQQRSLSVDSLKVSFGYCSLGNYDGEQNELYVPSSDGWIYILDAITLKHKDRIYAEAEKVYSVASAKDLIVASCSDNSYHGNSVLKVFRRGDKVMTDNLTVNYIARTRYLHKSTYEFVDISTNTLPAANSRYIINSYGKIINQLEDSYHGDYPLDPALFHSFPNGKKFITSAQGAIYNSDLTFEKMLSNFYEDKYQDYAISKNEDRIYAALREANQIDVFAYPSLNKEPTIFTKLNPFKIFSIDGNLIVVSRKDYYGAFGRFIYAIEKIDQ